MTELRPREITVLRACWHSVAEFGIANYLPSPREQASARRLIERELLMECKGALKPDHGWTVVTITGAGILCLSAALAKATP